MNGIFDQQSREGLRIMQERNHYRDTAAELFSALCAALDDIDQQRAEGIEPPQWYQQARKAIANASQGKQ